MEGPEKVLNNERGPLIEVSNKEELERITELYKKVSRKIVPQYPRIVRAFEKALGFSGIGESTVYNTPFSVDQLCFALALSQHPLVVEVSDDESIEDPWEYDASHLVEAKVLTGIKALDLGCGEEPYFARLAHLLGAEMYTTDVIPYKEFFSIFLEEGIELGLSEYEESHHITLDLNLPDATELISQKTGGLNLITEAHADTGGMYKGKEYTFYKGKSLASRLLVKGGVHFYAEGRSSRAFLKSEDKEASQ